MTTRSTKTLKNKADKLWSIVIRQAGECIRCHRKPPEVTLQAAHVISRKYTATRWDLRNGFCMCVGCHHWGHMNPAEWGLWIIEMLGADLVTELQTTAREYPGRLKKIDLEEVIASLQDSVAA